MKKFFALTAMLCLVLGFQNCSESALQNNENLGNSNTTSIPTSEGKAVANVSYVEIPDAGLAQNAQKASELNVVEPSSNRLVISVQSGVIQLLDDANAVLEERCLSAANLNELNTILSGSAICAAAPPSSEVCGERYKPAYASIFADNALVSLGEEQDSCGTGKKDLCGNLSEVFQTYVSYVKAHWQEMNCQ